MARSTPDSTKETLTDLLAEAPTECRDFQNGWVARKDIEAALGHAIRLNVRCEPSRGARSLVRVAILMSSASGPASGTLLDRFMDIEIPLTAQGGGVSMPFGCEGCGLRRRRPH